jgi:hypothetical protein
MSEFDFFLASGADDAPVAGIKAGTIAVWRGADETDFGPAIDPLNNLGDVRFHSDFDYLRVAKVVASTDSGRSPVTLPLYGENQILEQNTTLFAHGMGIVPLFIPQYTVDGYVQPGDGSPMLNKKSAGRQGEPRFIGMTADETNIYMHARGWLGPAATVHWRVWVLNEEFGVTADPEVIFHFDPESVTAHSLGKLDEHHRFIRKVGSSPAFRLIGKSTFSLDASGGFSRINYHDGVTALAVSSVNNNYPAGSYSVDSELCDV